MLNTATTIKKCNAIAIGGFDAIHVGHKELFKRLGKDGCIVVIDSGFSNLTPGKERERFVKYPVIYFKLDDIRDLSAKDFIQLLQEKFENLKTIVVGYDFHFGKNRMYDINDLKNLFDKDVIVVDEVKVQGESVHSNIIRKKLATGDIKSVTAFLGRNYEIKGKVIAGQGIAKKKLVATANLEVKDYCMPKEGVYATLTSLNNEEHFYPSVSFIGHRVTTDGSFAVETHILDKDIECSGILTIKFVAFLRNNKKFDSLDELKKQIQKDIKMAKDELRSYIV